MVWQSLTVTTQNEAVDAVSNILMEAGAAGLQIADAADRKNYLPADQTVLLDWTSVDFPTEGAQVTGYFPDTVKLADLLPTIRQRVQTLANFGLDNQPATVELNTVTDTDWATEWEKYYHPVQVSRHLTVVPKWEHYQASRRDEVVITLDPGLAFGTGTHPTTKLMLQALEVVMRGGERVIDVGTGSGVLAIAASLMGAKHVLGTDLDAVAVRSAKGNVALNPQVGSIEIQVSDLLADVTEQANDLVVANMLAEVLLPLIPQVKSVLALGGWFLLSGIYYDKVATIKAALQAEGYQLVEQLQMDEWYGLIAQRQPAKQEG
ncbi:50S ribosomal protein L11 methyltransferase [Weissella halotolerans]|uniref:Ribosomal protein L11 methyltransferase n=1 Tax=Weissella halotolerans DSM 20190 TaxID=1123500 RepID=A0A0R2FTI2_9LACO|nr:50S ribosomal protein L11 methyltransferase [Weissella halotolerans]KRN31763.1 ribosomal protein L11 methyltransferase [Weissella halotolerans DSM 20190]